MKALRRLLAPSIIALLPACTAPSSAPPEKQPALPPAPVLVLPGTLELTATWKNPGGAFGAIASASAGNEGAIAYSELETPDQGASSTRLLIKVQRIDSNGAALGSAVELGAIESSYVSDLTLASDGNQYVACWAHDSQIACAAAPIGQGSASPGLSLAGGSPSLAYSSGTWALAYAIPGRLAVVPLSSDGTAAGSPAMFEAGGALDVPSLVLLASTKGGFALVGGENMHVYSLDQAFSPIAKPIKLGVKPWAFGAIAAFEAKVAINLSEPYGSNLFLIEDGVLKDVQPFGGGGKGGLRVALTAEEPSFGMLRPGSVSNGFGDEKQLYRVIEQGGVAALEYALDADFDVPDGGDLTLLWLGDELFIAATQNTDDGQVVVARVHRL